MCSSDLVNLRYGSKLRLNAHFAALNLFFTKKKDLEKVMSVHPDDWMLTSFFQILLNLCLFEKKAD